MEQANHKSTDNPASGATQGEMRPAQIALAEIHPDPDNERAANLVELARAGGDAGLAQLMSSLDEVGLIDPLQLYANGVGSYRILQGHRRWAAAQALGWDTINAYVVTPPRSDAERDLRRLIPNELREETDPIRRAQTLSRLLEAGRTQEQLGREMGKTQGWVASQLRLLELPEEVREAISDRRLTVTHGEKLLKLSQPGINHEGEVTMAVEFLRLDFARRAIAGSLSVGKLDELIDAHLSNQALLRQNAAMLAQERAAQAEATAANFNAFIPAEPAPVVPATPVAATPLAQPAAPAPAYPAPASTVPSAPPAPTPAAASSAKPQAPAPAPRPAPAATASPTPAQPAMQKPGSFAAATAQIAITLQPGKDDGRSATVMGRTEAGFISRAAHVREPEELLPVITEVFSGLRGQYGEGTNKSEQSAD